MNMIEFFSDSDGDHHFRVTSSGGDVLFTSIGFPEKADLQRAIQKLKESSLSRNQFERKTSTEGKFLFLVHNDTGEIIGQSELYDSEAGMANGIENLKTDLRS